MVTKVPKLVNISLDTSRHALTTPKVPLYRYILELPTLYWYCVGVSLRSKGVLNVDVSVIAGVVDLKSLEMVSVLEGTIT